MSQEEVAKGYHRRGSKDEKTFLHHFVEEKAIEEFTRDDEFSDNDSYRKISVLNAPRANRDALEIFLAEIAKIRQGRHWDKDDITAALRRAVPDLRHEELGRAPLGRCSGIDGVADGEFTNDQHQPADRRRRD